MNTPGSPLVAALLCRCPRCGKGRVFGSLLNTRDKCEVCGLDYTVDNTGDGAAVLGIFILGIICLGGALIAEFKFGAPWWIQIVLWGLLTPIMAVIWLRVMKAIQIALHAKEKADEGHIPNE